ncbi:type IV pilus twitching motility protein PilT [Candidatus Woesebacteria bacterium]|nr:type IV pilus twitching motility protein PilT [Candidatus Woesebacteria bacterium]MCD8507242.1 type IV pilus twitching motility protein PilT [Candidatus Woesebacteria bacterium]MCD8526623.1 type IV pilus twitching motility protein PilT [Candidatus Woesebacteria bacterium]MCD8546019.1 type IV pilus twitching motility protein PilT [Candidatus Woesebacteria bacterium]
MAATLVQMIEMMITYEASDLHLVAGHPPHVRIHGDLLPVQGELALSEAATFDLIKPLMNETQQAVYEEKKEVDFSYQYGDKARFRVNVYTQRGSIAAALRLIPIRIKTIDELGLPPIIHDMTKIGAGLVLVTGPTGTGKSSTLAAMIQEINESRAEHILTIEDPIEFVYEPVKSVISQREVHEDTLSWTNALRSSLREDPDIVLVGEMRDLETIQSALTVAETGHLVFATLHTNSGPETVDRIIDVFPQHQQSQVRQQLAASLKAVVSQRLIQTAQGDARIAAMEILVNTSAVENLIREGKTFQIDNVMQTSSESGMMTMEAHLVQLINSGKITYEAALRKAIRPAELDRLMGH